MSEKSRFLYLCSPFLYPEAKALLSLLGGEAAVIPPCDRLDDPVSHHPDMLFSVLSDGKILTERRYYNENKTFFSVIDKERLVLSEAELGKKYPADIAFDCIRHKKCAIGKKAYTAAEIINDSDCFIDVKQGYALCSTLKTESFAITADAGIREAMEKAGVSTLLIKNTKIELDGYGCGFIGGACCCVEKNKSVVFFGDVSLSKDFSDIKAFINKYGYDISYLKGLPLKDFGGIKII